ncbi:MAG: hypothetical protein LBT64_01945 [Puniceicoccales bacterium]|jgi:hypothetical protein|nr:hypothetical protein [Puniceicoccales bacterium]
MEIKMSSASCMNIVSCSVVAQSEQPTKNVEAIPGDTVLTDGQNRVSWGDLMARVASKLLSPSEIWGLIKKITGGTLRFIASNPRVTLLALAMLVQTANADTYSSCADGCYAKFGQHRLEHVPSFSGFGSGTTHDAHDVQAYSVCIQGCATAYAKKKDL